MADDEQAVEGGEGQRRDREEVHRGDSLTMISQERQPAFRRFGIPWRFAHPARDRSLGNIKAEQEQLTVNPRCAPARIFGNHPEDQIPNRLRDSASANTLPADLGQHAPIEPESSSVPLNHRFGKDEDENCFQSDHTWLATTQNSLSSRFGLGLGCRRLYTASCCRRTRFSSSRLRRAQNRRAMVPRQSRMMLNIAQV